ncbi:MAG: DUF6338 family protein [Rhodococcus sp. (in: high G+C Gram-positive bacteria)]|uniref:DUF6338 family protein n=1 Tax=Rhodococcus sp. TaxID=1831 RepID=UPI003BB1FBDA
MFGAGCRVLPLPNARSASGSCGRYRYPAGLALVYIIVLGGTLTRAVTEPLSSLEHPRLTALAAGVMVFVVPALVAVVEFAFKVRRVLPDSKWGERFRSYDPTPTAWDYYSSRMIAPDDFVRVLTKDGGWIGGQVGATGFFTGYPETREVFLETAYALDESGTFGETVEASAGVWVDCSDAQLVQVLRNPAEVGDSSDNGTNGSNEAGDGQ